MNELTGKQLLKLRRRLSERAQDTTDKYAILDRLVIAHEYTQELVDASKASPKIPEDGQAEQWIVSLGLLRVVGSVYDLYPSNATLYTLGYMPREQLLTALDKLLWLESLAVAAAEWRLEMQKQQGPGPNKFWHNEQLARVNYERALARLELAEAAQF